VRHRAEPAQPAFFQVCVLHHLCRLGVDVDPGLARIIELHLPHRLAAARDLRRPLVDLQRMDVHDLALDRVPGGPCLRKLAHARLVERRNFLART
jgi:hypothetical protein